MQKQPSEPVPNKSQFMNDKINEINKIFNNKKECYIETKIDRLDR